MRAGWCSIMGLGSFGIPAWPQIEPANSRLRAELPALRCIKVGMPTIVYNAGAWASGLSGLFSV